MNLTDMNFTQSETNGYHCYLLRLRRDGEERPWRASMHCSATGTLHHFANIASLLAFLQAQTDGAVEPAVNEQK